MSEVIARLAMSLDGDVTGRVPDRPRTGPGQAPGCTSPRRSPGATTRPSTRRSAVTHRARESLVNWFRENLS